MTGRAAHRNARRWLPVAVWAAVIFGFSSIPGSSMPSVGFDVAPLAHFAEYTVLGALVLRATGRRELALPIVYAVLAACSLYGVSDEFHQSFVLGRTPDVLDWTVDTMGAAFGIAATIWVRRRRT